MKDYTETQDKQSFDFAYDELSLLAKQLLSKCNAQSISSPLTFCRFMQEKANMEKRNALIEVEKYLINE